jgi:hypothetical protein
VFRERMAGFKLGKIELFAGRCHDRAWRCSISERDGYTGQMASALPRYFRFAVRIGTVPRHWLSPLDKARGRPGGRRHTGTGRQAHWALIVYSVPYFT